MVKEKYEIFAWKTCKSQGILYSIFSGHPVNPGIL